MHLGIITSGNETLFPTKFLHNYCKKYTIWYDSLYRPYGDKPLENVVERTLKGIQRLREQGVDIILLPPIMELYLTINHSGKYSDLIPLFQTYLTDSCFRHSLVGKLGIVGTALDVQYGQQLLRQIAQAYQLTDKQANTKKFCQPFSWRNKAVPMRNYFLRILSGRQDVMNKIIKEDCRYFKDANVDTIIPMQYSYFAFERRLHQYFNPKKQKFHGIKTLEEAFQKVIYNQSGMINSIKSKNISTDSVTTDTYDIDDTLQSIQIHFTGSDHLFTNHKKWAWMVSAGKPKNIKIV